MAEKINAAIIDKKDTVVVAIEKINAGETVTWRDCFGNEQHIVAKTDVPIFHKIAITDMPKGSEVVKYGEHIGLTWVSMYTFITFRIIENSCRA